MAELIDKGALYDAMTEEYLKHYAGDVANSFTIAMQMVQNQPTVTESEIRAMAIDEFAEKLKEAFFVLDKYDGHKIKIEIDYVAEQLKEE